MAFAASRARPCIANRRESVDTLAVWAGLPYERPDLAESEKIARPNSESRPAPPGGFARWYTGYFLLAIFNIVTITASVLLNYALVRQHEKSVEVNRHWAEHTAYYAEFALLISKANLPGADVFVSRDPRGEKQRMDAAITELTDKLAEFDGKYKSAAAIAHPENLDMLIDDVRRLAEKMNEETSELLARFARGEIAEAGRWKARTVETRTELHSIVGRLEHDAQAFQLASLDRQIALGETLRRIQYVIGFLIALLVLAVVAYGYRLTRRMRRSDEERTAHLAALAISESRFRELAEGSIEGIIVHRDGAPLFVNDAWAGIHGFGDAAAARLVKNIADLIVPGDRGSVRKIHDALLHGAEVSRKYEYRATRVDGKAIWLECLERVVSWQDVPALQSTVFDATDRKQAEAGLHSAMQQAEKATSTRTRFFAAASHDLRQPLHAISLYLPMLYDRVDTEKAENLQILGAIRKSCDSMRSLLDSLLDISRLDAGVIEPETGPVALLDMFDQLAMEFAPQAAAAGLRLQVVPADYRVRSDAILLERILRNLLTNAIRYTRAGKILLGARRAGSRVRIEIWDTGVGIDHEDLGRIFEEFYQADSSNKERGLGLGLAIIDRLVTLLGHKLAVRSWPGRGSVFTVTLPVAEDPPALPAHGRHAPQHDDSLAGRHVLLIEDDPILLQGTGTTLEKLGCTVVAAASAADAIASVRSGSAVPDIIVADLDLHGDGNGLDAIATISLLDPRQVPVIFVTGETDPNRLRPAAASGHTVLHKPVEPALLQSAMLEAIGEPDMKKPPGEASRHVAT